MRKQRKNSDPSAPVLDPIHDDPGEARFPPARRRPCYAPQHISEITPQVVTIIKQEKPPLSMRDFDRAEINGHLATGTAFESTRQKHWFNYAGIGTEIRFVAVRGAVNWAVYVGPVTMSAERVAEEGDKVFSIPGIRGLLNVTEDLLELYRFG